MLHLRVFISIELFAVINLMLAKVWGSENGSAWVAPLLINAVRVGVKVRVGLVKLITKIIIWFCPIQFWLSNIFLHSHFRLFQIVGMIRMPSWNLATSFECKFRCEQNPKTAWMFAVHVVVVVVVAVVKQFSWVR